MFGDVLDWDSTFQFISFLSYIMGLKHSKTKKGGVPPPGSAEPPCKLEEEANVQRVTTEPVSESINGSNTPSSPTSSPLSDVSPLSIIKDCETPSTAEEISFVSCLTEGPSSFSDDVPVSEAPSERDNVAVTDSNLLTRNPESSLNSVSQSVALNNTQNGIKKDSEYESAEEIDLPPDHTFVITQQPSSENLLPPPPAAEQVHSLEHIVTPCSDKRVSEEELLLENSIKENCSITGVAPDNICIELKQETREQCASEVDVATSISESLVTVIKHEIIEESISKKTIVQQEVTEVIPNYSVLNGEVNSNSIEVEKELSVERQYCSETKSIEAVCETVTPNENGTSGDKCDLGGTLEEGKATSPIENFKESNKNYVDSSEEVKGVEDKKDIKVVVPFSYSETSDEIPKAESIEGKTLQDTHIQQICETALTENPAEDVSTSEVSGDLSAGNQELVNVPSEQESQSEPPVLSCKVDEDDPPIPPNKGYCLDFLDCLDDPNYNPFATKTAVRNTPPPSPEAGRKLPPLKPAIRKKKEAKSSGKDSEPSSSKSEHTAVETSEAAPEKTVEETPIAQTVPSHTQKADQLLEVTFEESSKPVKQAPPRLARKSVPNKKPVGKNAPNSKVIEKNNNRVDEKTLSETEKEEPDEELPIPPPKGYNLDFLDNLDDPSFNPFVTQVAISNSPPKNDGFPVTEDQEIKPKAKVVPAKKPLIKKGFAVIKGKAKVPKQEQESKTEEPNSCKDQIPVGSENKPAVEESSSVPEEDVLVPPKKGYNLAFLDDPDFDPFKSKSTVTDQPGSAAAEVPKVTRQVLGGSCTEETKGTSVVLQEVISKQSKDVSIPEVEEKNKTATTSNQIVNVDNDVVDSIRDSKEICNLTEETPPAESTCTLDVRKTAVVNDLKVVDEVKQLEAPKTPDSDSQPVENHVPENEIEQLKAKTKSDDEQEKVVRTCVDQSETLRKSDISLPKVPSIGTIGHLDSLEFAQLLGNEASRLAEEFMNCSTDSGLPDSDDSVHLKSGNLNSSMADRDISTLARLSAHLDENINPFQKNAKLHRSPPLGKRDMCGAEGGDATDPMDHFKPRRIFLRESIPGEDRLDTSSLDEDSGIVLGTQSDLETDVNHSEAGPEIATGLTSSDLQCASQFFKEATDIENQLRKSLATPGRGSQSKLSGDEVTPTKNKPERSTPEPRHKSVPSTSTPVPPHEERSAPEGTSSPTPRPSDTSEHKSSSSRPNSISSEGYMTAAEVQKLLKQQELQFEEKLLRAELASGEKEKKLRQAMKDEQKEMSNLGETVSELTQSRDALLKLVGQYKGMLASLVSEKEKEKQNQEGRIKMLEQERNQALEDLANVEVAFSDVHRKYERTKQVVDTLRRNEETLRGAVSDYESKLQKQEQKFIEFQKHAEEKIQLANEEFEVMRRTNDQEMTKMSALLKKAEMKIMSLQDSNDRKTRENQELTQLCDDLINKVGTSH